MTGGEKPAQGGVGGGPAAGFAIGAIAVDYPSPAVARVRIGDPNAKQTILEDATIGALEKILKRLEAQIGLRGVIFTGCAPGRFIAGADVRAIEALTDTKLATELAARGQKCFHRISRLPWNTVAAIDGVCLGGGLELALACGTRIATDSAATLLGLPEVLLGIIPGFGGTTRLPRLLGYRRALGWILTGRRFTAREAMKEGVVDQVVPAAGLDAAALEAAQGRAPRAEGRDRGNLAAWFLDRTRIGRGIVASRARKQVLASTRGRYPAPLAAIETARRALALPVERALELEAIIVGELATAPITKELIRIFWMSENAKKVGDREGALRVASAVVVGAGIMGAGIAALLCEKGVATELRDVRPDALAAARARLEERLARRVREGRATEEAAAKVRARLRTEKGAPAEFALEAIVEDLPKKKECFAALAAEMPASALLATNTSALSITEIQAGLPRPERIVGLHFFNPVERMPLVEVVRGRETSPEAVALAAGVALRLGKTPIVVGDCPGFLVNRILGIYIAESARLLGEGLSIREIDRAAVKEGMPVGPFALLDEVGIDVANAVSRTLVSAFGARFQGGESLAWLLQAGRLGRKSGAGFYRHKPSFGADPEVAKILGIEWAAAERGPKSSQLSFDAGDRLMLSIAIEARRARADGVAESDEAVDLASILGFGYPAFRGGPLRDLARRGAEGAARLAELHTKYGEAFAAVPTETRTP